MFKNYNFNVLENNIFCVSTYKGLAWLGMSMWWFLISIYLWWTIPLKDLKSTAFHFQWINKSAKQRPPLQARSLSVLFPNNNNTQVTVRTTVYFHPSISPRHAISCPKTQQCMLSCPIPPVQGLYSHECSPCCWPGESTPTCSKLRWDVYIWLWGWRGKVNPH